MEEIEGMSVQPLVDAKFVKPFLLRYKQNGKPMTWEVSSVHPSVSIIIFNVDRKKLVFVKQFRPAVYFSTYSREERELFVCKKSSSSAMGAGTGDEAINVTEASGSESRSTQTQNVPACKSLPALSGEHGVTIELCAGVVDKDDELKQIAKEEVFEECGYDVKLEDLEEIITCRSGVGISGEKQTVYFTEVRDVNKTGRGGGLTSEGEFIEVVEMSIEEVRQYLQQREVRAPSGLLMAMLWFLANKATLYE
ncbi:Nucleoside diphosphate pyrophosphatase [Trinorchestia longiramus]|nr:Nucleoside diphosphate pyrophosphatase [Trinorchestia longiramus]